MNPIEASYGLTPVQHGMLFQWLRDGAHTGVDVEQMVLTMREEVDGMALRAAWARVTARHPALRTRFRWAGLGEPLQDVVRVAPPSFVEEDLRGVPRDDLAAHIDAFLREDRARGFELDVGPLSRLALLRVGPAHHCFVWTFSHAILDGGSFARIVNEVFTLYDAGVGGDVAGAAPRPYADHVAWVRAEVTAKQAPAGLFWRSVLAGFTAPTPLPWSRAATGAATGPHLLGEEEVRLSRAETDALRVLAGSQSVALGTCVQAAWALLLAAHAGEEDVVFGAVRACRRTGLADAREMAGVFINTLPVRVRVGGTTSIVELLRELRAADVRVREFEHTPLADVQACAPVPRGRALFDSIVVFNSSLLDTTLRAQGGAWVDRELRFFEQTGYALSLFAYAEPELLLKLSYDRSRFDGATALRLLAGLRAALSAMVAAPLVIARSISCLSDEERRALVVDWNDTKAPSVDAGVIHELIEKQVGRSPEAPAVTFCGQSVTYRELDGRATLLARKLRTLGVGPDVLVAICVERSIEMVVGLLGILKAGGAYVPLDPHYPPERLAWILEDAKPLVIVTQASLSAALPRHTATTVVFDDLAFTPDGVWPAARAHVTADNLAYVIFTSGSTGRPKGVLVRHRNVMNFFQGMDERVGGDGPGVWLAVTSISFDISVLELLWTLARGFEVVVQGEPARAEAPLRVASLDAPARPMDFSLFYFATDAADTGPEKYRLLLEGAKFADEHGFAAVWTPERHFHAFGGLYPNPSVTSAAIAVLTKHIQIRAGSIVLPLHNPVRVAEEWSVVDNLSGGRVGLSFASGWHADDFALAPANYADRREVMVRGIETVRALWHGEAMAATGGSGNDVSLRIYPAPVRKDPPVWLAAAGNPDTFALAGQLGASVLTNLLGQNLAELSAKIAVYRAARRAAGHAERGHITLMLHTFIGEDVALVRETVRAPFIEYLKVSTDLVKRARWEFPAFAQAERDREGGVPGAAPDRELTPPELDAMMNHAFERYFRTSGLFGTPQSCLPMVGALRDAGVDEIACLVDFGVDTNVVLESLERLDQLRARSARRAAPCADAVQPVTDDERWEISAQIRRHAVTHMQCTPSLAAALASSEEGLTALASLTKLLVGGEALPPALAERLTARLRGDLLNLYGPTETTVWSTTTKVERGGGPITIGRPIANTTLYVLDPRGAPVPIGAAGELFIGGQGVAGGYLGRPDLTAERFVTDPFSSDRASRLYRTGDRVRYRGDGEVEFLGRVDHQVKIRGHRVELGEIEALLGEHPRVRESVVVAVPTARGDQRIIAYVVPRAADATESGWQSVWDDAYAQDREREPTFDTAGWNDSITGARIPDLEMREAVTSTTSRILELRPQRLLDVGCGTGLLLFGLAPRVVSYIASDVSPVALRLLEAELSVQCLSNVVLRTAPADDFRGIEAGSVDTIVLNSVVQYFPTIEHLRGVLRDGMALLAPGGAIFVGDVRNLLLLPYAYAATELGRASDATARLTLAESVKRRAVRDPELAVDPAFFDALAASIPELASVSVQLKRGVHANELTRFRYDVVLRKAGGEGDTGPVTLADDAWISSPPDVSLKSIQALLREEPAVLGIARVPNARLARDAAIVAMLRGAEGLGDAGELRAELDGAPGGVDPEALFSIDPRYAVDIRWSAGTPTAFDVIFRHLTKDAPVAAQRRTALVAPAWARFGNQPARVPLVDGLLGELKEHLRRRLPEPMLPAAIVPLEALPRTPNGKIDRAALPSPDRAAPQEATPTYAAPANDVEATIAAVWAEVLNVEKVGRHENFFDLGANSLLVMMANSKLRGALGRTVSLVEMFRFTTVSALAAHLAQPERAGPSFEKTHDRARARGEAMQRRRDVDQTTRLRGSS